MSKKILILFLSSFCFIQTVKGMEVHQDSNITTSWFRNFNFAFNYVELGKVFNLSQKDYSNLGYGIGEYLTNIKGKGDWGGFGVALFYKDKIGIEFLYSNQEFSGESDLFKEYIIAKHPNHYPPDYVSKFSSSNWAPGFRICFRKHFKHFFIEPRIQFKPNKVFQSNTSFRIKEKGSNHFIQYNLRNEIIGRNDSYHAMLNIARKFDPFKSTIKVEVGLLADFMIRPVKKYVSITEKPFIGPSISNSETFKMLNPSISAKISCRVYFGYKSISDKNIVHK